MLFRSSPVASNRRHALLASVRILFGIAAVDAAAPGPAAAVPQGSTPPAVGMSSTGDASQTVVRPIYSSIGQTEQQRVSWTYDLAEDGARGDAASDTAALKRCLLYAATHPGTVCRFPGGTWALTSPGSAGFVVPSYTTIAGASQPGTILTWNDTQSDTAGAAMALFGAPNRPEAYGVTYRDFTVQGSANVTNPVTGNPWLEASNGGYPFWIYGVTGLTIDHVGVTQSRIMSISVDYSQDVSIKDCLIQNTQRDGISVVASPNVSITDNVVEHGGDDGIAVHSATGEPWGARRDLVITGNRIFDIGGGISASSARGVLIGGNTIDRFFLHGIALGTTSGGSGGSEGDAANLDDIISNNIVTNGIDRSQVESGPGIAGGDDYIQIDGESARTGSYTGIPGLPGTDGVIHQPYFEVQANSNSTSVPVAASANVLVEGNIIGRVIPPTDGTDSRFRTWTDLGMGPLFEDNVAPGSGGLSPSVKIGALQGDGIHLTGGAIQSTTIIDNTITGLYWALVLSGATDLGTIQFRGNTVTDTGQSAVYLQSLGSTKGTLVLDGNLFDLDPYQIGYGRGTHGTWSNNYGPQIINDNNTTPTNFSVVMERNTLRNAAQVSNESTAAPPVGWVERDNTVQAQSAALGYSSANKGVATIPSGGWRIVQTDSDPTSATYGQILQGYNGTTTGMPTTGTYVQGDYVRDVTVGGSVAGWMRQTTGSGNVLYIDWVPVPAMAGGKLPLDPAGTMWVKEVSGKVVIGTGSTGLFSIDGNGDVLAKGSITGNASIQTSASIRRHASGQAEPPPACRTSQTRRCEGSRVPAP